jgi:hypothetical protein
LSRVLSPTRSITLGAWQRPLQASPGTQQRLMVGFWGVCPPAGWQAVTGALQQLLGSPTRPQLPGEAPASSPGQPAAVQQQQLPDT